MRNLTATAIISAAPARRSWRDSTKAIAAVEGISMEEEVVVEAGDHVQQVDRVGGDEQDGELGDPGRRPRAFQTSPMNVRLARTLTIYDVQ